MRQVSAKAADGGPSPISLFCIATILFFAAMAAWSVAMPHFTGPDEPSHAIHAAAVVRGQLIGMPVGEPQNPFHTVHVPISLANADASVQCFRWDPTLPARSCVPQAQTTQTTTAAARYPPFYYAIVGIPSLLVDSPAVLIIMRLLSAFLNAVFLGFAVMAVGLWSRNRMLMIGVLLAVTPMTLYLGAVVNPNGLEICAAICLWASGLVLALEHLEAPPRGLVVVVSLAGSVLSLSRGLSPLWTGIILMVLAMLCGRRAIVSLMRRRKDVQVAFAVLLAGSVVASIWIVNRRALELIPGGPQLPPDAGWFRVVTEAVGQTGTWLKQMVGVFGSLETTAPLAVILVWWISVGAAVLLALAAGRTREVAVLFFLLFLVFAVPVLLEYPRAKSVGLLWQGRYTLPLAVGLPMLATAILGKTDVPSRLTKRLAALPALCFPVALCMAFAATLRRYAVGVNGPINLLRGSWQPAGGAILDMAWCLVATALVAALLWSCSSGRRVPDPSVISSPGTRFEEPDPTRS